ncbi:MAG: DinB family protein [Cyclobacteriaceae bacterium]|nr:DinB family protein [Cyclobacteriaceae bacterium]
MVEALKEIFERDLTQLEKEVNLYKKEGDLWLLPEGISNTAGNLCLHIAGNLQHFVGHVLGGTNYKRDRNAEFSQKNIPVEFLLFEIAAAKKVVSETLDKLTPEQLEANYPEEVFKRPMTTTFFLIHLAAHLNYHLGQINYHRRLLS